MANLGFKTVNEMIGRVDMLKTDDLQALKKSSTINLDALLTPAQKPNSNTIVYQKIKQDHRLNQQLDNELISLSKPAIIDNKTVKFTLPISNTDRAVGAMLSSHIVKSRGKNNLADGSIHINFQGSAGQSFGAFLASGITLEVEGDVNDYIGKGLCGGRIIVYPPKTSRFNSADEIIAGNVCGYGATGGYLYLSGKASERFCVRNSGATAVVEGVGDHGCEYMTGGVAIILGEVGRNFGAGMSGGIAYIYNPHNTFESMCNLAMIDLDPLTKSCQTELKSHIQTHQKLTDSKIATEILSTWHTSKTHFIKVIPKDYKLALQNQK